jgi:hypothetical protein
MAAGKPGTIFSLDQANLGEFNSILSQEQQEVNVLNADRRVGSIFAQPAYWNTISKSLRLLNTRGSSPSRAHNFGHPRKSHSSKIYNRR